MEQIDYHLTRREITNDILEINCWSKVGKHQYASYRRVNGVITTIQYVCESLEMKDTSKVHHLILKDGAIILEQSYLSMGFGGHRREIPFEGTPAEITELMEYLACIFALDTLNQVRYENFMMGK